MNKTIVGFLAGGLLVVGIVAGLMFQIRKHTDLASSQSRVEDERLAQAKTVAEQNAFSERFASVFRDAPESVKGASPVIEGNQSETAGSLPTSELQQVKSEVSVPIQRQEMGNKAIGLSNLPKPNNPVALPDIYEAIRKAELGASQFTGYDPMNPPSVNTISEAQFDRLNLAQQRNYLQGARRRKQMILDARAHQRQSADAAINAVVERYIEEKRKAVLAAESASSQLAKAIREKGNADAAKAAADQKLTELQKSIETAIDNGWVTQDARSNEIKPSAEFLDAPETVKMAEQLKAALKEIEREVAEISVFQAQADAGLDRSKKRQVDCANLAAYWSDQVTTGEGAINERRIVQAAEQQAASAARAAGEATRAANAAENAARFNQLAAQAANRAAAAAENQARSVESERSSRPIGPVNVRIVP
jgi:hypothetical protein